MKVFPEIYPMLLDSSDLKILTGDDGSEIKVLRSAAHQRKVPFVPSTIFNVSSNKCKSKARISISRGGREQQE